MVKGEQKLLLLVDVLLDEVTVLRDMIKHKDEMLAEKTEIIKKLWENLPRHKVTPAEKQGQKRRGRPKGIKNSAKNG